MAAECMHSRQGYAWRQGRQPAVAIGVVLFGKPWSEIRSGDLKPRLRIEAAEVRFGNCIIVDHASLVVAAGQNVSLMGRTDPARPPLSMQRLGFRGCPRAIRGAPNLQIGYVPQRVGVDLSLPIIVARFLRVGTRVDRQSVTRALEELSLSALADWPFQQVSGGEVQRLLPLDRRA